jgi:hypothetical protein
MSATSVSTIPSPKWFELTILAQDPSIEKVHPADERSKILRTQVRIPASTLRPGPRGPRLHVVDYDPVTRVVHPAYELAAGDGTVHDRFREVSDAELLADRRFHAQNAYAIAARTLAAFEFALGRRVPWAFGSHQLYLVPHALQEANAFYDDADQAVLFGDYEIGGKRGFTCLSHDIVAHETTHAILDGLRQRFDVPGLPDQPAFHEAFADIVAMLSVFSMPGVVERLVSRREGDTLLEEDVTAEQLRSLSLATMADELGDAVHVERGGGLRASARLEPTEDWKDPAAVEWLEPHRRAEILVAAVMRTLIEIWMGRLVGLRQAGRLDRERAAEEGSKAAEHLLTMMIRAIDYCPPVDFEFADFLDAALLADEETVPDDPHGYRDTLRAQFEAFGIRPRAWPQAPSLIPVDLYTYRDFNYVALRSEPEEAFRFIWENADVLRIDRSYYYKVEDVLPSVRVGPDGFFVVESVVDYVQQLETTLADLRALAPKAFASFPRLGGETPVKVWGGGTIVFDQFARVKYHLSKRIDDWERQARRLAHLVSRGIRDRKGSYGFSMDAPAGMRFALAHRPDERSSEEW